MKEAAIWLALLCLHIYYVATSNVTMNGSRNKTKRNVLEERKGFSFKKIPDLNAFQDTVEYKANLPRLAATAGGISTLATINYDKPVKQVIKEVGDAIMPMIQFGLSLIPGWGPLIGGIVAGIWGLLGPLFGGEKVKSPVELMIDSLRDEINDMKKQIKELAEKLPAHIRKQRDKKLAQIINKALKGELKRNEYICSKYALVSERFTDDVINQRPINESLRFEMITLMNDCDNFLKDTAGAFVYDEFADILWVSAVISTMMRLTFLADALNNGFHLKLEQAMIAKWWTELKLDTKRLFKFSEAAIIIRLNSLYGHHRTMSNLNFTSIEYDGCRIQAQLLYFDRDVYRYGIPKFFQIKGNDTQLKVADLNVTADIPHHIQIYYDGSGLLMDWSYIDVTILNCISGQLTTNRLNMKSISFRVVYVPNKSYQIRVLYFIKQYTYKENLMTRKGIEKNKEESAHVERNLVVSQESENTVRITISHSSNKARRKAVERFLFETAFHEMQCDFKGGSRTVYDYLGRQDMPPLKFQNLRNFSRSTPVHKTERDYDPFNRPPTFPKGRRTKHEVTSSCTSSQSAVAGIYVIEDAVGFIVGSGLANTAGKIVVETHFPLLTLIHGVELIVLPTSSDG